MGSTHSSRSHTDVKCDRVSSMGILADYETIYNYFDGGVEENLGIEDYSTNRAVGHLNRQKHRQNGKRQNEHCQAAYQDIRREHIKSAHEEMMGLGDNFCEGRETNQQRNRRRSENTVVEVQSGFHSKNSNKLKTRKQINAQLMARNAETQLKELEKRKYVERTSKSRRSKSLTQVKSEPRKPLQLQNQSAEYWQKRRELERLLKSEDFTQSVEKSSNNHQKREMRSTEEISDVGDCASTNKPTKSEDIQRSDTEDLTLIEERNKASSESDCQPENTDYKFESRAFYRNGQEKTAKSRSQSRKSCIKISSTTSSVKTEAELLEELKGKDKRPVKQERRAEVLAQHVPHYALPTKKMELKTNGRLGKLYVLKKVHTNCSEWPDDLNPNYCKMVVKTFKDMYLDLVSDSNWVYNQRKSYLNFINTAEWQEMDLKLAKMSFQQLHEEPMQNMHVF